MSELLDRIPEHEPPKGAYIRGDGMESRGLNYEVCKGYDDFSKHEVWDIYTEDSGFRHFIARQFSWMKLREFFGYYLTNIEYLEF